MTKRRKKEKVCIERIQKIAKNHGGKCLSKTYIDMNTKLEFECDQGHIFKTSPLDILYHNNWCRFCSYTKYRLSIEEVKESLHLKNLNYISGEYKNHLSELTVSCNKNHTFITNLSAIIKAKIPCRFCRTEKNKVKQLTFDEFKYLAEKNGNKYISETHNRKKSKFNFICDKKHQWFVSSKELKNNKAHCPHCATRPNKNRKTKQDLKNLIKPLNLKCLNIKHFKNASTILDFECENKHIWKTSYSRIYSGARCLYCAKTAPLTIEICQNLAKERGGKLISTEYINNQEKMLWECCKGHQFWMSTVCAKNMERWCPHCYTSKTETICREIIEEKFKFPFPKIRPKWLIGNKKMPLELDGYCKELNLAFEYNGRQHQFYIEKFHSNYEDFLQQQVRDKIKIDTCNKLGIKLIVIPHIKRYNRKTLTEHIDKILLQMGLQV